MATLSDKLYALVEKYGYDRVSESLEGLRVTAKQRRDEREHEIDRMLAANMPKKEIASALGISRQSVYRYIRQKAWRDHLKTIRSETSLYSLMGCGMDVRTFNSLKRGKIETIEELCNILNTCPDDLLALRNFGLSSLRTARSAVEEYYGGT